MFVQSTFGQNQVIEFQYGDERYMDYYYVCSFDNGYVFKKKLPDGKYIAYSSNNPETILVEGFYLNHKKTGTWKYFKPNEKTMLYKSFQNGNLISDKYLDSLQRIIYDSKYINNQEYGNYYNYYENGQLKSTEEYWRHNRKSTQIIKEYYSNGNLKSVIRYLNNRRNSKPIGKWEIYYENGQSKSIKEYGKNWREIGIWIEWNENGEIISEINKEKK